MNRFCGNALAVLVIVLAGCSKSVLVLEPNQGMSVTGKGPGQDAVSNPFAGSASTAVIQNIGENELTARVEESGRLVEEIIIKPGMTSNIDLKSTYELYLDSELGGKAKVSFKGR